MAAVRTKGGYRQRDGKTEEKTQKETGVVQDESACCWCNRRSVLLLQQQNCVVLLQGNACVAAVAACENRRQPKSRQQRFSEAPDRFKTHPSRDDPFAAAAEGRVSAVSSGDQLSLLQLLSHFKV